MWGFAGLFNVVLYIGKHFFDASLLVVSPIAGAIAGLIIGGIFALRESDKEDKIGALLSGPVLGVVFGGVAIGIGKLIELFSTF